MLPLAARAAAPTACAVPASPAAPRSDAGFPDGPSRADEVDDWGKNKSFVPSSSSSRGFGGGGFRERDAGGAGGFGAGGFRDRSPPAFREPSRADTEDRWSKCVAVAGAGQELPGAASRLLSGSAAAVLPPLLRLRCCLLSCAGRPAPTCCLPRLPPPPQGLWRRVQAHGV